MLALVAAAIGGCIEFGGAYEEYCAEHPAECFGDAGTQPGPDGGPGASDAADGGGDAGAVDAGDASVTDAGPADSGTDAGDAGPTDAGDAGKVDAGEAGPVDAGFDGGFDAGPPRCDPDIRTLGGSGGPDICAYGEYCSDAGSCTPVVEGTCPQATVPGGAAWTIPGGPVIYAATATPTPSTDAGSECAGGGPAGLVQLSLYAPFGFTNHGLSPSDFGNHAFIRTNPTSSGFTGSFVRMRSPPPAPGQVFVDLEYVVACDSGIL